VSEDSGNLLPHLSDNEFRDVEALHTSEIEIRPLLGQYERLPAHAGLRIEGSYVRPCPVAVHTARGEYKPFAVAGPGVVTFGVGTVDFAEGTHRSVFQVHQNKLAFMMPNCGALATIHCMEGLAVCPSSNTTDVLDIVRTEDGWTLTVQTTGADNLLCFERDSDSSGTISLPEAGIHTVSFQ